MTTDLNEQATTEPYGLDARVRCALPTLVCAHCRREIPAGAEYSVLCDAQDTPLYALHAGPRRRCLARFVLAHPHAFDHSRFILAPQQPLRDTVKE